MLNVLKMAILSLVLFLWVTSVHSQVVKYGSLDFEPRVILLESWGSSSESWGVITSPKTPLGYARVTTADGSVPGLLLDNNKKLFGLNFAFVYPGFNKIEILPPKSMTVTHYTGEFIVDGERSQYTTFGIELPGRVKTMSLWILSRGCECYIEAVLEDWKGTSHSVYLGDLKKPGWSNKKVEIPARIPQNLGSHNKKLLIFRKFVLRTYATLEPLEESFLYFDLFRITTELNESNREGSEVVFDEKDRADQKHAATYLKEMIPYKASNRNTKFTDKGKKQDLLESSNNK